MHKNTSVTPLCVGCIKGTLCSGKLSTLIRKLGRRKKVIEEKENNNKNIFFPFSLRLLLHLFEKKKKLDREKI